MITLVIPNLVGVDHWRSPSLVQMKAKTLEKMTMKIGLMSWTIDGGISMPKMWRSRRISE